MPRKQPFSGKAKKVQLMAKRDKKQGKSTFLMKHDENQKDQNRKFTDVDLRVDKASKNRYKLQFKPETKQEIQENRERSMQVLIGGKSRTACTEDYFSHYHDFPQRPAWEEGWSREQLEANEQRAFRTYVTRMLGMSEGSGEGGAEPKSLSYFELNLETWRQLWRVLEKSDLLLMILDVRYAAATFPPALYEYIMAQGKQMVLVLNKIDLVPATVAAAWKHYFHTKYPSLHVVFFTSFPSYNLVGTRQNKKGMKIRKRRAAFQMAREGAREIWSICQKLYGDRADLLPWKRKIEASQQEEGEEETLIVSEEYDHTKAASKMTEEGMLTIGTLGHPNVGKSSLINSLCGKKVVSVSRTPGHTKHFQTIFLTKKVRLCDCPGLVFPSKAPKPLQVLMGSFPISQVREPYSVVMYLAERLDVPSLLDLQLPEGETAWSAFQVCEAWAIRKGFVTARTSRPDTFRAANLLLRFALDGKICLYFEPPGYSPADWVNSPDARLAEEVTATSIESEEAAVDHGDKSSHEEDSDDDADDEEEDDDEEDDDNSHDDSDDDSGSMVDQHMASKKETKQNLFSLLREEK